MPDAWLAHVCDLDGDRVRASRKWKTGDMRAVGSRAYQRYYCCYDGDAKLVRVTMDEAPSPCALPPRNNALLGEDLEDE